ncbi:MAG TPA: aminotransferase class V-fold PLP-dependent enzyme, partial [Sphingomicrobium sp.]|nr:aminotransferase class V-fold PLP-dependent enzyme [Sphingomicrobium sp.]
GGVGAMPRPVFDATVAAMAATEQDPFGATYGPGIGRIDKVRAKVAGLLNCQAEDIVLTGSATAGMFLLAQGLALRPGDRILTTDHEHPAGRFGWEWVARRYDVGIDTIAISPAERDPAAIVERVAAAIRPQTRVLSFSHILFTTGVQLPAAELCALARERGCLSIVDGAQSAGAMPVDVAAMGCHAYAASGHKWLMGPKGTGFLYLSPELEDQLDALPLQAGRRANSDSTGIGNIAGMHGLGAAVDYVQALGLSNIETHNLALRGELYDALVQIPGIVIPSPRNGPTVSANMSFTLPAEADHHAIRRDLLMRHNIYLRVVEQSGFIGLRASMHAYNGSDDVGMLVRAIVQELG